MAVRNLKLFKYQYENSGFWLELHQTNSKQEILLTYWFITCTVWAVAILATALICLLLRYIDGDQDTNKSFTVRNDSIEWRKTKQDDGSRDGGDAGEDWRILGTQAHNLTWHWSQKRN